MATARPFTILQRWTDVGAAQSINTPQAALVLGAAGSVLE